jgi:hypothetical protein
MVLTVEMGRVTTKRYYEKWRKELNSLCSISTCSTVWEEYRFGAI